MRIVTRHLGPKPTANVFMCDPGGSGSRAPIASSQFSCEQLQRHVVTDPDRSLLVFVLSR